MWYFDRKEASFSFFFQTDPQIVFVISLGANSKLRSCIPVTPIINRTELYVWKYCGI